SYVGKDHGLSEWWGGEVKITAALPGRNKVTVGSEYRDNAHLNQSYGSTFTDDFFDVRKSGNVWALYFQDDLTIRPYLILSAGVRHDQYSTFGGTTNPRFGLIYSPAKKTSLKLLYGQAFRAPNAYELFYGSGHYYKPNHSLRPETIKTTEVVWEQYAGDHLRFAASGFYSKVDGLINQITDPADGLITFRNLDSSRSKGFEFEMETRLHNGMEGRIGYTLQNTENPETGMTLSNSPRHLLKANWIAPIIREKFFAGLDLQYTSARETLAGNRAKAFWLPNLTLSGSNLFKRLDVSVGIYNLFDKKYGDPGAEEHRQDTIHQDGRNFRVKLTWRFDHPE
ncbi:MAG TPA: TonB-dependent receptor, partial [Blastocatellia bacterium]